MTTLTLPPSGSVRVRVVLRGVLAFFVFVLGLGLAFTSNTTAAHAYTNQPTPIDIGEKLKTVPSKAVKTGSMIPGPVGFALKALNIGLMAYQTKDSWLPVVEGGFTGEGSQVHTGQHLQGNPCSGAWSIAGLGTDTFTLQFTYSGSCSGKISNNSVYFACMTGGSYTAGGPLAINAVGYSDGRPFVFTRTSCVGGMVASVTIVPTGGGIDVVGTHSQMNVGADAIRQRTTVNCKHPDGTITTISDVYVGGGDKVFMPSCHERVGPGTRPDSGSIRVGVGGAYEREVQSWTSDQDVYDEYADCFGPSGLQCDIRVYVDGMPCYVGMPRCEDWWDTEVNEPDRVRCKFGTHVIPKEDCRPLRRSYKKDAKPRTLTETKTDGSIDYGDDPDIVTDPSAPPTPQPSAPPTVGPNPEVVTEPPPEADPNSRSCFGEMWSWNPVDWVYVPVKCAFIWAFKPKTALSVRVDTLKTTLTGRAPFSWGLGFAAIPAAVPGGACPDWRIKVAGLDKNVVCESSFTAAIRSARPVLLVFMGALAVWPLLRSTMYAAFPVLKPQPGVLR